MIQCEHGNIVIDIEDCPYCLNTSPAQAEIDDAFDLLAKDTNFISELKTLIKTIHDVNGYHEWPIDWSREVKRASKPVFERLKHQGYSPYNKPRAVKK